MPYHFIQIVWKHLLRDDVRYPVNLLSFYAKTKVSPGELTLKNKIFYYPNEIDTSELNQQVREVGLLRQFHMLVIFIVLVRIKDLNNRN